MKKLALLIALAIVGGSFNAVAQSSVDTESCLLKKYKQSELDAMSADQLAYEKFVVENAVMVYPMPEGKPKDIYPTKKWTVESNVCVYDLKVEILPESRVNFFSKNDMLVTIYSEKELKKNYEKNK